MDDDPQAFRLWFHGGNEPYVSEVYCALDDETVGDATYAVCKTFDWIENPPNVKN
jgi:hypothetical protein